MSPEIRVVKNWINGNIEEIGCCQDVADHFGVKLEALSRRFARDTGSTMLHYIKKLKMNRAMMLLRSEDIPCYEIASRLKLGTPQYAAGLFKREFGHTMTDFRRGRLSDMD